MRGLERFPRNRGCNYRQHVTQTSRHIEDFTQWKDHDAYQKAFDRLMRDLKAEEPAGND